MNSVSSIYLVRASAENRIKINSLNFINFQLDAEFSVFILFEFTHGPSIFYACS